MSIKTIFSITLILIGVIGGALVIFGYAMSGGEIAIAIVFLMVAIACIITGSIIGFPRLLDRQVNPLVDELLKGIDIHLKCELITLYPTSQKY